MSLLDTNDFEAPQSRAEELLTNIAGGSSEIEPPQSRAEKILHAINGAAVDLEEPQSRVEKLLMDIYQNGGSGAGVPTGGVAGQVLAKASGTNYDTEWVNASSGLDPLIGTTATVTPQQVMTALGEGRDVCITATTTFQSIPFSLKFAAFNRATDGATGQVIDMVISQTMVAYGDSLYLFELIGGTENGASTVWTVRQDTIVRQSDVVVRSVNGQTGDVSINYLNVGAVPNRWGTSNVGKFLVVGPDGYVNTQTLESADTTSY